MSQESTDQTTASPSKRQIGWVIRAQLRSYTGCKVYMTEGIARRYAGKTGEILPAFIEE